MPVNNNSVKHNKQSTLKQVSNSSPFDRKAAGTRYGTFEDWREGSVRTGNDSGRHGYTIRDGRK